MSHVTNSLFTDFPERRSSHTGTWIPLYMEPLVGSGERICIGVAAADSSSTVIVPVDDLERFTCVYGAPASAFAWAANLALADAQHEIARGGLVALTEWAHRIDGLSVGESRRGAGTGLADLARVGLQQVSALVGVLAPREVQGLTSAVQQQPIHRLDSQVRKLVMERRPQLRDNFARTYRPSQSARPLRYGFVGSLIVANFASLTARSTSVVSAQVDKAKARLWDLQQLDAGILADSLPLKAESLSYELLVHRPLDVVPTSKDYEPRELRTAIKAAEEELEAEADKFDIRFRPMRSPNEIARYLVEREAA